MIPARRQPEQSTAQHECHASPNEGPRDQGNEGTREKGKELPATPTGCDGRHIPFRASCSIMTLCYFCVILCAQFKTAFAAPINPRWLLTRKLTLNI
jgi:hypothetical protein